LGTILTDSFTQVWSAFSPSTFKDSDRQTTITASYDPSTQLVSEAIITNVGHDMFCEGLSMDFQGRIMSAGGNSDYATSLYDSAADSWTKGGVSQAAVADLAKHIGPMSAGIR